MHTMHVMLLASASSAWMTWPTCGEAPHTRRSAIQLRARPATPQQHGRVPARGHRTHDGPTLQRRTGRPAHDAPLTVARSSLARAAQSAAGSGGGVGGGSDGAAGCAAAFLAWCCTATVIQLKWRRSALHARASAAPDPSSAPPWPGSSSRRSTSHPIFVRCLASRSTSCSTLLVMAHAADTLARVAVNELCRAGGGGGGQAQGEGRVPSYGLRIA